MSEVSQINGARRALLRGGGWTKGPAPRLPWADAAAIVAQCSRCGDCARACEERIIRRGDGGFPSVDFERGGCTFCGACRDVCKEAVFETSTVEPWGLVARVGESCFGKRGVVCESCREICEVGAVRLARAVGAAPLPVIDAAACTGCGFCIAGCPAGAMSMEEREA